MAETKQNDASPIKLTVATAERREVKMESPLFYILPPLVVVAVFVYCMVGTPNIPPAVAPTAKPAEEVDIDDLTDEELNVDDEADSTEE